MPLQTAPQLDPAEFPSTTPDESVLEQFTLMLEPNAAAAATARSIVRELLNAWNQRALKSTATIVVSELVANAVRHGAPPYTLHIELTRHHLVASVEDSSPRVPIRRDPSPTQSGGWGLQLIAQLADDWGFERCYPDKGRSYPGKRVWATLERW